VSVSTYAFIHVIQSQKATEIVFLSPITQQTALYVHFVLSVDARAELYKKCFQTTPWRHITREPLTTERHTIVHAGAGLVPEQTSKVPKDGACQAAAAAAVTVERTVISSAGASIKAIADQRYWRRCDKGQHDDKQRR